MIERTWNRRSWALCDRVDPVTGKKCNNRIMKGESYYALRHRRFCKPCGEKMQH